MRDVEDNKIEWSLVKRGSRGLLTAEERERLQAWLSESPEHKAFYDRVSRFDEERGATELPREQYDADLENFVTRMRRGHGARRRYIRVTGYVAACIIPLFIAFCFWKELAPAESVPGKGIEIIAAEKAHSPVLITGEGTRVDLNASRVEIEQALGTDIRPEKQGLSYANGRGDSSTRTDTHKLLIPRAGEYRVVLSDGSTVWLNSETEFCYPTRFTGGNREVTLKGEAYFEVTKKSEPFLVHVNGVVVKVYGTSFNINSHDKDMVQTVLVSGRVGVSLPGIVGKEQILHPNEMAEVNTSTGACRVKTVDTGLLVSWREGYFSFDQETIERIMAQLTRWYDLDVIYRNDKARSLRFSGHMERSREVGDILKLIGRTGLVEFEVNGKQVIVK